MNLDVFSLHIGICDGRVMFNNCSPAKLLISHKPQKPKRKPIDFLVVMPGHYVCLDGSLDINNLTLRFEYNGDTA